MLRLFKFRRLKSYSYRYSVLI
uniref:Uncharacterized protein n=1 Tax=Rhizophora mucronata TaxID=61149 RepID=A0A2P2QY19_RHIMU